MSARAAFRSAGKEDMGPVVHLHDFSALQITVEENVRTLILRDFILVTACFEEIGTDLINNEVSSFFINE